MFWVRAGQILHILLLLPLLPSTAGVQAAAFIMRDTTKNKIKKSSQNLIKKLLKLQWEER